MVMKRSNKNSLKLIERWRFKTLDSIEHLGAQGDGMVNKQKRYLYKSILLVKNYSNVNHS